MECVEVGSAADRSKRFVIPEPQRESRFGNAAALLAFLAVGALLYFGRDAFVPVAIALFLALLLTPAVDRLHRWRVPRSLAAMIVMLGVLLAGATAVNAVWNPAKDWLARAPQTFRKIDERVRPLRKVVAQVDAVTEQAGQLAGGVEVGRYFATITLINLALGAATAAAVAALGMPNAILWGTVAAVFNFIPYLGPITIIAILGGAALLTFDDLPHALLVPGAFIVLHLLEGQIVQPLTVGRRLKVNALVVLLAVWFGFWFWGIAGVLLAVPTLVALKVAADHQPSWQAVRNFLAPNEHWQPRSLDRLRRGSEQRGHSLVISDPTQPDAAARS